MSKARKNKSNNKTDEDFIRAIIKEELAAFMTPIMQQFKISHDITHKLIRGMMNNAMVNAVSKRISSPDGTTSAPSERTTGSVLAAGFTNKKVKFNDDDSGEKSVSGLFARCLGV